MKRAIALGAGLLTASALGTGWAITRRLTAPAGPRSFDLTIHDIEQDDDGHQRIVLDRNDQTTARGIYNLWIEHGGWVQLAAEVSDRGPGQIARTVTGTSPGLSLTHGDRASWSGIYYATPADAGLKTRDITITTPAGQCPAWRIDGDPSTWAIHIHGLGSTRAGTLRGVLAATDLGYTPSSSHTATPQKAPASVRADPPSATPRPQTLTKPSDTPSDEEPDRSCCSGGQWEPRSPCNSPTGPDTRA
ncbi:MAG: hypothetical protein M9952_01550 [Microthrixaceae bacterium]|nr:hypothetical protein [Microthrixaceae bacterium]